MTPSEFLNANKKGETDKDRDTRISRVCKDAGTNFAYFKQIASRHRHAGRKLAMRLAKASGYEMTAAEIMYLSPTEDKKECA